VRRFPALLALLALVACSPEPIAPPPALPAPAPPRAFEDEPAAAARIAADVTHLASPALAGRGTGEPGGEAAARFIEQRFRDLGLAPAAGKGSYLQDFSARVGAKVTRSAIVVHGQKATPAAVAAVGSASASVRASAVFAGYGITAQVAAWDDYAGADLGGKIAVVLAGTPTREKSPVSLRDFGAVRYKLRNAREHKAAGVVIVAEDDKLPAPPTDASSMGVPAVVVTRNTAAALFPTLRFPDRKSPYRQHKPMDLPRRAEVEIAVEIQPVEAPSWNVIGLVPGREGSSTKDEVVVIGAHYDHLGHGNQFSRAPGVHAIHPGADDNASGAALLLEVARRFAALPERPPRSVAFMAFGAEEIGSLGSRHWTKHPTLPLDRVVAMLNADMVGRLRDDRLVIDGVSTSRGWAPLIQRSAEGLHLSITLGGEGFGASDHASFTAVRVPVAFFFTGVHEDYHMPSDTADKINVAGEERIATLVARVAMAVAEERSRLSFVDAPADPHKGGRGGFKVALGTIPDYAFTGKGLRLDGVRAGGPAARGGLGRGDVIVKVGPHEIGNIHDFMFALGELTAGREVTIEVLRDNKRVSLQVIPAPGR
jgi:hypothetical protein